jgi:hypothetical protein
MVPATDLLALGIRLMETCESGPPQRVYKSTQFRDGLMIALLICCPMRLRNLTDIVSGRHLIFDGHAYRLEFTAAETKTGRPYVAAVPPELTTYLDDYLHVHRPTLQSIALARGASPISGGDRHPTSRGDIAERHRDIRCLTPDGRCEVRRTLTQDSLDSSV